LTSRTYFLTIFSDGLYYSEILTDRVEKLVSGCEISTGIVNLLLQHTTSALMLVEHEGGIMMDLKRTLQQLVPPNEKFHHHLRGVDQNGAGHVLSAILNKTLSIPVVDGTVALGTYQEIMFMDFQPERTDRVITVTVLGDCES